MLAARIGIRINVLNIINNFVLQQSQIIKGSISWYVGSATPPVVRGRVIGALKVYTIVEKKVSTYTAGNLSLQFSFLFKLWGTNKIELDWLLLPTSQNT